ncbi:MAG: hypothetical protein OJI67_20850 [Prosthecobacter sp.]|nr:hypothetical protein [Prosthecobacter sp.]
MEQKLSFLKGQQKTLDAKIRGVEYALSIIREPDVASGIPEDMGMTDALLHILDSEVTWWTATPLAERLKELGFDSQGFSNVASFNSAVSVTLKRLAASERVLTEKQDGRAVFGSLKLKEDWI